MNTRTILRCIYILLLSTLMINHFDLFGLPQQLYLRIRGVEYTPIKFGGRAFLSVFATPLFGLCDRLLGRPSHVRLAPHLLYRDHRIHLRLESSLSDATS